MYLPLGSESEEVIPFLQAEQQHVANKAKTTTARNQGLVYLTSSAFLLVTSFVLALAGSQYPTDAQCTRKMSTWSPMLEAVKYEWRHFREEKPNVYYGKPTDELEKAWGKLWEYGSAGVPDSKLHLLNKSRDIDWKYLPDELGGGVEAFFEAFHQIHCIDLLRQFTYRDEYDYSDNPAFLRQPDVLYNHVDHCIETLRINIMCTVDVTPYLIEVRNDGVNVVRTDGLYRCRDFDKVIEWAEANIVRPYNVTEERIRAIEEVKKQSVHGDHGEHTV